MDYRATDKGWKTLVFPRQQTGSAFFIHEPTPFKPKIYSIDTWLMYKYNT